MASKRIYVAGHNGMVGSALVRQLSEDASVELVLRSRNELNLTSQEDVSDFFANNEIDEVYLAAARVGGIHANNTYPAEFIYQNAMIECNIIHSAHLAGIDKLLFLGSSCIYPRLAVQPMSESSLLTGLLEPTNEPYAIAKILGIKLRESYNRQYGRDYRSVMPTNLYGPNDNFHPVNSHVIPGLIRRFNETVINNDKTISIWGTGNVKREFLHVDDMAAACLHVLSTDRALLSSVISETCSHINVGTGKDCTIRELAETLKQVSGFQGELVFDTTKPDGAPQKLLDTKLLNQLGWQPSITLEDGLASAYVWFCDNK